MDLKINIGDFVYSNKSIKPGLVVNKNILNNEFLISIDEYNGDYIWIQYANLDPVNLESEEKLSIIANFGSWFYDQHKEIYQEILIENLQHYII